MIIIKVFREIEKIKGFEIKGHALHKSENEEYDLVCAGVSSISITAVNGLQEYLGLELCKLECNDGYLLCQLPQIDDKLQFHQAQAILETMVLGLKQIAEDFSKHIKFV